MSTDTATELKWIIDSFIGGLATGTTAASCVTALFVDIHCRVSWSSVYSSEANLSKNLWKKNLSLFSQNYKYLSNLWFEDYFASKYAMYEMHNMQ